MAKLFFRNFRLLLMVVFLLVVWSVITFESLPRLEDPELTSRFALITTLLPGGTAERTESLVTEPIENVITEIPEVETYESTSRAGVSTISVELQDSVKRSEVPLVWSRMRDKLRDVAKELPPEATEPDLDEVEVRAYALLTSLIWTQDDQPNYAILQRRAENLENALRSLPGTDEVEIFGAPGEEITVEIDTETLASLGLTSADLAQQIQLSDAKTSAGLLRGENNLILTVQGELDTLQRLKQIPIRCVSCANNQTFRVLGDIARIQKGIPFPPDELVISQGKPALVVGAYVQPQFRLDRWYSSAERTLAQFRDQLPEGLELKVLFNQTKYVTDRLNNLIVNLVSGSFLLFAICVFMMGWEQAVIVQVALPLSLAIAVIVMFFLGIPLHQMSVTGLIVALGILIDNAIILVDEMYCRLRGGMPLEKAIEETVSYLVAPLFGGTLTTVFSFAPISLLPGAVGEFVGTIGLNVILAVLASLLVALTITPALAARMFRWTHQRHFGSAGVSYESIARGRWWEEGFNNNYLNAWYRRLLLHTLERPVLGILLSLSLPLLGFVLMTTLSLQFFPPADRSQLTVEVELPPARALTETRSLVADLERELSKHPEIQQIHWFFGRSAARVYYNQQTDRSNETSFAGGILQLDRIATNKMISELQDEVDKAFPAARVLIRQFEQGSPFEAPIELRIFGSDIDRLQQLSEQARSIMVQLPAITHIRTRLNDILPQIALEVDEAQARSVNLSHRQIAQQLQTLSEGTTGGTILEDREELPIRVRLSNNDRSDLERLQSSNLITQGGYVPLGAIGKVKLEAKNAAITRRNGRRVSVVQGYLTAGTLPAEALKQLRPMLLKSLSLPQGYSLEYGGEEEERNSATGGLVGYAIVLSIALVVTLVLSMDSFLLAGLIGIVAILSVGLGGFSLWLFDYPFGFNPIIGTVGLIGVAVNDSITVLTALKTDPQARSGDRKAMVDTVIHTTRHVITTTLTTMAGFVPLILAGGGFWPPLAVVIAGGVGGATILALFFIPSAYLLLHRPSWSKVISRIIRGAGIGESKKRSVV